MSYGKFVCYPSGNEGNPQNTPYPYEVHEQNAYRRDYWRASHLRTFRWHLYKQIREEDLLYSKTGKYYFHAEDLATSFPCLEMCPKDKIGVVDFYTYVFNESQSNRARGEAREAEAGEDLEVEIRNRKPYNVLDNKKIVISSLGGGLGNMMFMTAASLGVSAKYNHTAKFYDNHYGILHGTPMSYKDTVFRNIPLLEHDLSQVVPVSERSYHYTPLDIPNDNVILNGYFQSYKYFEHCKDYIKTIFSCPSDLASKLREKYDLTNTVSIHVRRGNYVQLSNNHYNLTLAYYTNAVTYFRGYKFLVFSDDIEWCKETFKGDVFTFVEGQSEVEDLYLMSLCTHNVIANSTFSWWGAYLNTNPNKIVVYPNKWFGPGYADWKTSDLFPDEWVCLNDDAPAIEVNLFDGAFGHLVKPNGRYSSVHDKISSKVVYEKGLMNHPGISLFTDGDLQSPLVKTVQSGKKIGWLLETKELDASRYDNFEQYMNDYDLVMTHDKDLLSKYPDKAVKTIFGGTWIKTKNYWMHEKTKNVSMIYSDKKYMTGHKMRHEVAEQIQGIDLYGRGTPRPINLKEEALLDYRFSIVIENSKTDNYFTEKLIDCIMVGTIPIYWGCPNIDEYLDVRGMIIVSSVEEIKDWVGKLNEAEYLVRKEFAASNLKKAIEESYDVTEDWMYKNIFHWIN